MKMSTIHVEESRIIPASPQQVYAVIADYHEKHPAILPRPYFNDITVEQGGIGEGTVIRFSMTVMGRTFHYHQRITEPEPGRKLVETDLNTGQQSAFIFEPLANNQQTRLTIASDFPRSPGFAGIIESITQPPIVRRIYRQELQNIADYVQAN